MNLVRISHQVEITLWSTAVGILSDRRTLRTLSIVTKVALALGILSITFGIWIRYEQPVRFAGHISNSASSVDREPALPRQLNTLVAMVDQIDFEGDPDRMHLQSLWLAVFLSSSPKIYLAPIYPGSASDHLFEHNPFQLGPDGAPTQAFTHLLQTMDVRWDHYIVIDRYAIQAMGRLVGWEEPLFVNVDEPEWPLTRQATHAYELCHHLGGILVTGETDSLLEDLDGHISTDLASNQVIRLWQSSDSHRNRIFCEFPTLETARPTQHVASE